MKQQDKPSAPAERSMLSSEYTYNNQRRATNIPAIRKKQDNSVRSTQQRRGRIKGRVVTNNF